MVVKRALPTSGGGPKHVADDKKKVIVKAAPSSAQKALADLRPFLRFADGKDSDTSDKARPPLYQEHLP